jgi:hypothetical protein
MRSFSDEQGVRWDAVVGRESWGSFVLLFTPTEGGEPRKAPLVAETMLEAEQELESLAEADLHSRLAASDPWA